MSNSNNTTANSGVDVRVLCYSNSKVDHRTTHNKMVNSSRLGLEWLALAIIGLVGSGGLLVYVLGRTKR